MRTTRLPEALDLVPAELCDQLPRGLTDGLTQEDAARIAAAHAAARTASTRRVYGYAWRQWAPARGAGRHAGDGSVTAVCWSC